MAVPPRWIDCSRFLALAFLLGPTVGAEMNGPEAVIQAEIDAYNAHDIKAFMSTYASDAEIFDFPAKLLMKGGAQIEDVYKNKFVNDSRLHATIARRMVMGDMVVDLEQVLVTFPEGPGSLEAIAINEVRDGKIRKVTLIRGKKVLDSSK